MGFVEYNNLKVESTSICILVASEPPTGYIIIESDECMAVTMMNWSIL